MDYSAEFSDTGEYLRDISGCYQTREDLCLEIAITKVMLRSTNDPVKILQYLSDLCFYRTSIKAIDEFLVYYAME